MALNLWSSFESRLCTLVFLISFSCCTSLTKTAAFRSSLSSAQTENSHVVTDIHLNRTGANSNDQTSELQHQIIVRGNELNVVVPAECLVAAAVGAGVVAASAASAVLASAGFSAEGVTAGSVAATWQTSFGEAGIAKGSLFAALQSASMGGLTANQWLLVSGSLAVGFSAFCAEIDRMAGMAGNVLAKTAKWISNSTLEILDDVRNVTPKVISIASNTTSDVLGYITYTAPRVADTIGNITNNIIGQISDEAPKVAQAVSNGTSDVLGYVGDTAPQVARAISNATQKVVVDVSNIAPVVSNATGNVIDYVGEAGSEVAQAAWTAAVGSWNWMTGLFR